jgi:ABC-type uncharacterized transport system ATPase subunit
MTFFSHWKNPDSPRGPIAIDPATRDIIQNVYIRRAGVPSGESGTIIEVIERLPHDIALLIIEHDMDLVFRVAQRITVLVQGSVLVEGPPAAIARDPEVRRVYLGERAPG